jgi:hypothetical protein
MARHALGEPSGIDENERRSVLSDQVGQSLVNLVPDLSRHHSLERKIGDFQRQIAGTAVS